MKLYAAHPLTSYGTPYEARQLEALREHFPGADVLDPAAMFSSNEDWLAKWPEVLATLDALVLFADQAGHVGAGVLRELSDAIGAGLPVLVLGQDGQLYHFGGFSSEHRLVVARSRAGRLLFGPPVSAAGVMALVGRQDAPPLGATLERCSSP